ncbi:Cell division control protein 48 [Venturia nashicola]|uniref:Cell division control protein 48 n=1 Tax=Venturia nashicola TaxID=86259 RepID=A0A4Z1P4U2_9PEZI|nr:Cell division control protein 48 [Venturia nashicola]
MDHANESSAKRPALHQRTSSNLDPGVPVFIPNPQAPTYVSPAVPKVELNPQKRRQEQKEPQYFHQQQHLALQAYIPPPLIQLEVHDSRESGFRFDPYQQVVASLPLSSFRLNPGTVAHVNNLGPTIDSNVAALFEEAIPFVDIHVNEPETQKKIKQSSRAARWREKKAFEAGQKAQIESSNVPYYENGGTVPAPGSVDESELKFEEPLAAQTHTAPGFCRADGSWINTSAIHDDGSDRAAFELHHRVGLNRQQPHRKEAPIKPIARLMHEEIRERWFSNDRPAIRLNESMSGYARRVVEMLDMSEQQLELLIRDREVGMKVKEIALIYQGVIYPQQKEYYGHGVWR